MLSKTASNDTSQSLIILFNCTLKLYCIILWTYSSIPSNVFWSVLFHLHNFSVEAIFVTVLICWDFCFKIKLTYLWWSGNDPYWKYVSALTWNSKNEWLKTKLHIKTNYCLVSQFIARFSLFLPHFQHFKSCQRGILMKHHFIVFNCFILMSLQTPKFSLVLLFRGNWFSAD